MKKRSSGSSLLAVLLTMAAVSGVIGVVFSVTINNSRMAKHTVDRSQAVAYADAVIETVFDQWRQAMISVNTATDRKDGATNGYLAPFISAPSTVSVPPPTGVSLVSPPTVLAATPLLVELTASSARPTPENGTNWTQRTRLYYVATATVSYPSTSANNRVTIKRAFVRGGRSIFDNFYFGTQPVTEFHPGAPMYIGGSCYIGGDLYTAHDHLHLLKEVSYLGSHKMDYRTNDSRHGTAPTIPNSGFGNNWDLNNPPHRGSEQKLLDVRTSQLDPNFLDDPSTNDTDSDSNPNNDGYREIIEEASGTGSDPLQLNPYVDSTQTGSERLANNADYRITVAADNSVTVYAGNSATPLKTSSAEYVAINTAITTNTAIKDVRNADYVKLITVDVGLIKNAIQPTSGAAKIADTVGNGDGLTLYIKDTSAGNTGTTTASGNKTKIVNSSSGASTNVTSGGSRGVKLVNGGVLPNSGLSIVTPHSVYIKGDFNTGSTSTQPATNTAVSYVPPVDNPSPVVGTYVRPPSAVAGDAVNILSNAWNDANSDLAIGSRVAAGTTINTAIVAGNVPTASGSGNYSGGIENFVRFHENWSGKHFTIYGAVALLYDSTEAKKPWGNASYNPPDRHWYYDSLLQDRNPPGFHVARSYDRGRWVLR